MECKRVPWVQGPQDCREKGHINKIYTCRWPSTESRDLPRKDRVTVLPRTTFYSLLNHHHHHHHQHRRRRRQPPRSPPLPPQLSTTTTTTAATTTITTTLTSTSTSTTVDDDDQYHGNHHHHYHDELLAVTHQIWADLSGSTQIWSEFTQKFSDLIWQG